ncbi:MAG: hypothetical protein ACT4OI_07440 [Methanobacteriota archaeon]
MKFYDETQAEWFRRALEKDVLKWPGGRTKRMMGCLCYFHKNSFFAFLVTDGIVITKLREEDRPTLSPLAERDPPQLGGKALPKTWVKVPMSRAEDVKSVMPFVRRSYVNATRR